MSFFFKKIESKVVYSHKHMLGMLSKNIDKHIWLVCAPKSGSTWLTRILQDTLKWQTVKMVPSFGNREQEIDLSCLLRAGASGKVLTPHQHCRYSAYTHEIIDALDTKVIFQVRDIFDTILSFYDHIEMEGPTFPSGFMNESSWSAMDELMRYEYLVDLVIPWYFNFYCGWMSSELHAQGRLKLITYNELRNNTIATVGDVLSYCEESSSLPKVQGILEKQVKKKKNTRQNKGVLGRGDSLPESLKERVKSFTKYYPHIDFGPLGL